VKKIITLLMVVALGAMSASAMACPKGEPSAWRNWISSQRRVLLALDTDSDSMARTSGLFHVRHITDVMFNLHPVNSSYHLF